jgi:lipid II isoglutaminyl synthase (glutamine-hydrolysing)
VTTRQLTVAHLYPDVMSTHGDRGNVAAIVRRCRWRDIDVTVIELGRGDRVVPDNVDLIVIGGGGDSRQRQIAADLYKVKGGAIRDAVAAGTAALAVGGGYELFGRFSQPARGVELRGIELFDSWTIHRRGDRERSAPIAPGSTAVTSRADSAVQELVVRWGGGVLVGFEDSAGGYTYLGTGAIPLGHVVAGRGNNGDGSEGVRVGGALGTNLRGPCLPANPGLADFLIKAALRRRYGGADLAPLPDDMERAARIAAVNRAVVSAPRRVLAWPLRRHAEAPAGAGAAARSRFGLGTRADTPQ